MSNMICMYELVYPFAWDAGISPMTEDQLIVVYSDDYSRKSDDKIERLIQTRRLQLLADSSIYMAPKFRFAKVRATDDNHLEICLGPTNYLDYLVTNHNREFNLELTTQGMAQYGSPDAYLSNALGNLAIVSTLEDKVALLLRSTSVATFSGYYDMPGGHPEPDMITGESPSSQEFVAELFESIVREITDELNIQRTDILGVSLLGLIRSLEDGRKPEMIFHAPINMNSEDLMKRYKLGGKEQCESRALIMLDLAEVQATDLRMTAPTRAAFDMFARIRKGTAHRPNRAHARLNSNRFAAIILDFDGVIADSERAQLRAWAWALREHGLDTSNLRLRCIIGRPDEDIAIDLAPDLSAELRSELLQTKVRKMREIDQEGVTLVTGAKDFVRRKSKTHVLAIASNSRSGRLSSTLEQNNLARYFHVVVTAGGKLPSKPDPAIYLETLRRLDKLPSECMVIEDSIAGLEAARSAGIYTVGITTGLSRQDLLPHADWVIDSFAEIE